MHKYLPYIVGTFLGVFALLTLYLSGSVIFDLFGMRAKQGDFVWTVIWGNFIASMLYLMAVYGFFARKRIASIALLVALVVLLTTGILLFIHIHNGGIYMTKTPKALLFRFVVTLFFFISAKKTIA